MPLSEGRACLTAHAHDPEFKWQQNFQLRGNLLQTAAGWALEPRRLVGGFEAPPGRIRQVKENLRKVMRFRKTAKRELRRMRAQSPPGARQPAPPGDADRRR
jgi:hypothetical protein